MARRLVKRGLPSRQGEAEAGPDRDIYNSDLSPMTFYNRTTNRKTQPGSVRLVC